ncbi:hypothetical protein ABT288_01890 [Streptomyces sp. NPDC001093]|uniref:hypothetical protein n=1 Tax=Streptomyces sp. NPDC001093 TaxID=3154376 RepID=UPI0033178A5F
MSDDLTTNELTTRLRELATANETTPPVAAPGIRRRAVRRGRRRRTALTLGAGTAVLALAAFALTLHSGDTPAHRQSPAATAPRLPSPTFTASPAATPVTGRVDFEKQTLTIGGRVMHITPDFPALASAGLLTVSAKLDLKRDTVDEITKNSCKVAEPYVVELRGTGRTSVYAGSLTCAPRPGSWIGLGMKDAMWLYNRLEPGDTLSVVTPRG